MITDVTFVPGDTVKVYQKIQEGDKTRVQIFEGVVIGFNGRGENRSFHVQKMVGDVAVERIWPLLSPMVEKVEVKAHAKKRVKRANLTNLRKPRPIVSAR